MSEPGINLQKKRVVVLFASVACMSGGATLLHGHRVLLGVWILLMAITLVYGFVEMRG